MDLSTFTSWQFMFLTLGIAAITFVLRKLIEYFILENPNLPGDKKSKICIDLKNFDTDPKLLDNTPYAEVKILILFLNILKINFFAAILHRSQ